MSANDQRGERQRNAPKERSIHMWERVERVGKVYYVPLDKDLQPISDIGLQDVPDAPSEQMHASEDFLLGRGIGAGARPGALDQESLERLVVAVIRKVLENGEATTYQICEALICRLDSSDFGEGVTVDIAGLLRDNFWYFEMPAMGGYMIKKWTLDQERAKAYWRVRKKLQPGPLTAPQTNLYN